MRIKWLSAGLTTILALSGCSKLNGVDTGAAAYGGTASSAPVYALRSSVSVANSKFDPSIEIDGIEIAHTYFGGIPEPYMIRSWIDKKTHAVKHQLYVVSIYPEAWEFWNFASDEEALALPFSSISREVVSCERHQGCSHSEIYGVTLPDAKLRSKAFAGYQIKVSSQAGRSEIFTLTPQQITAQIIAIDSQLEKLN